MEESQPRNFWSPLLKEGSRRDLVLWLSVAILMTLQVYPGEEAFYVKHFAGDASPGPLLDWHKYTYHHLATLLLFAIVPILLIKAWFKESLKEYGLQVGDWRFGLKMTLAALVIMPLPIYISSSDPEFLAEYPLSMLALDSGWSFFKFAFIYLIYYIGWEIFFRGFIGFGLKSSIGAFHAMMAQTALSTIIHIGKPQGETLSAIPGGIYMGLLAYRTRSILWPLLFHWYIGLLNTFFCGLHHLSAGQ